MLDLLPDLSGQPSWVVVVVMALFVAGTVGVKWLSIRAGRSPEELEEGDQEDDRPAHSSQQPAVTSDAQITLAVTKALDLLANEAVESQGARAEADQLRRDLIACSTERDRIARSLEKAHADLEQCNLECRRLAMRALERGGDSGE